MWTWLALAVWVSPALGYFSNQELIPNGNNVNHPCKANYKWPGVGHKQQGGGGERNVFGQDFQNIGNGRWTVQLCQMDSDGDGRSNGEELGDPTCVWRPGAIPTRNTDITHPGVCEPFGQGICTGRDEFVNCDLVEFEKCDVINEPDVISQEVRFPTTKVPASETNYFCMTFDIPSDQDYHMVAYEEIIDNRDVMHHIVMYGCGAETKPIDSPTLCDMSDNDCFNIIGLWTVGLPGKCMREGFAFRTGNSSYQRIRLEFHYNNPKKVADYTDSSGMKLYFRPARDEVQDLVTFMVGQRYLEIPPGQREVKVEGVCSGTCTGALFSEPVYVVEAINHMHYLGRSMKMQVYRNGQWLADLTNDEFYSYDSPVAHMHDPPLVLYPGDEIRTTCVYNSLSSDRWVYFGDGTADEMCFGFLFMYPSSNLPHSSYCVATGKLDPCGLYSGQPIDGCDWAQFIDASNPQTRAFFGEIARNCNLDGFCRPECLKTLETVRRHPCMKGDAGKFVKTLLADSKEGLEILGRYHSCPSGYVDPVTPKPTDCKNECHKYCQMPDSGEDDDDFGSTGNRNAMTALFITAIALCALFFK